MPKGKQAKKFRNFMYSQKVSYLPDNMSVEEIYTRIKDVLKPKRIACILHDKDLKEDGLTAAEDHIHIMLQFENARSVNQVAKEIGDTPQYLEIWKGSVENGFSYLIHATDNARHKHQYSCDEVKANFDYSSTIARITKKVSRANAVSNANKINGILDLVATGEMTYAEAKNQLTGSEYAKVGEKLKKAHELHLERSAEKLHEQMINDNSMVEAHWLFGSSEVGKSRLAEILAIKTGLPYFKTTATRDPLQFYAAEPIIILDELRPEIIPYSELLALLDPFSRGKVTVSSRYFNKPLSFKTIYITTPYSPVDFFRNYKLSRGIDRGEQLYRRLSSVMLLDMDWIHNLKCDFPFNGYYEVDKKPNKYSRKNQDSYILKDVFDSIE